MTAYIITTAVPFSDMDGGGTDYAAGDSLTINAGGTVTADISIAGAGSGAITVNGGGTFIQNAGISLEIATATAIVVQEGGLFCALGTSGSRCTIIGNDRTSATHRFYCGTGGRIYLNYTDVSLFYYIGSIGSPGTCLIEIHNSTIDNGVGIYFNTAGGNLFITNSEVDAHTASQYALSIGSYGGIVTAINTAFTSTTDNFFIYSVSTAQFILAGCTYQGIAIESGDIPLTTSDYDIRIYEKSVVTCSGSLSGAAIAATHPSQDADGLVYDSTNYLKIPASMGSGLSNSSGVSNQYNLQKTAYWPSGLAVGSRTWKYWSDSSQTETGDNQKFTVGAYKSGYTCTGTTAWSGAAAAITMAAVANVIGNRNAYGYLATAGGAEKAPDATAGALTYYNFTWMLNATQAYVGGLITAKLYNSSWELVETLYTSSASFNFTAGTIYNLAAPTGALKSFTAPTTAGWYAIVLAFGTLGTDDYFEQALYFAVGATPSITGAAMSESSINLDGSTVVTCTIANMTGAADESAYVKIGTTGRMVVMTTNDNEHYSATVTGYTAGTGSHALAISVTNATSGDGESVGTLTVADNIINPVTLVIAHLDNDWDAGNVTKPTILDGATSGQRLNVQDGDVVTAYRSARPRTVQPRAVGMDCEDVQEYIVVDIRTASGRARIDALVKEVERIVKLHRTSPGGGYTKMWPNSSGADAEYPALMRSRVEVELWKMMRAVPT